jgi:hypothetical protein
MGISSQLTQCIVKKRRKINNNNNNNNKSFLIVISKKEIPELKSNLKNYFSRKCEGIDDDIGICEALLPKLLL